MPNPYEIEGAASLHSSQHDYEGVDPLRRTLFSGGNAFKAATKNDASNTYNTRGVDPVDARLFVADVTNGFLKQTVDWGTTFSNSKGNPTNVAGAAGVTKIVRFGAFLYALCIDSTVPIAKISRTLPQPGNTAFSWADMFTAPAGATTTQGPNLYAGSQYLFYGTYGAPVAGPALYRSPDGVTWTVVYGPDPTIPNHIHAVAEDPYNAGHIYMTTGDGGAKTVLRSLDHGATWTTIIASSIWQAVQISFDRHWVWLAHDSQRMTATVFNRVDLVPYVACPNYHWQMAVPGAAVVTNRFYRNAYYGAVDPATGIYYCTPNDTSAAGTTNALLFIARPGADVRILDDAVMAGEVFFGGGFVWAGQYHKDVLTVAEVRP